jgi:hypothetical protein
MANCEEKWKYFEVNFCHSLKEDKVVAKEMWISLFNALTCFIDWFVGVNSTWVVIKGSISLNHWMSWLGASSGGAGFRTWPATSPNHTTNYLLSDRTSTLTMKAEANSEMLNINSVFTWVFASKDFISVSLSAVLSPEASRFVQLCPKWSQQMSATEMFRPNSDDLCEGRRKLHN